MRYLVGAICLIGGTSLLWSWVAEDVHGRWMVAAGVTLMICVPICWPGDEGDRSS